MHGSFADWYARSPIASILRVFVAVMVTLAVTQWATEGSINFGAWQTWLISALVSVLPALTRYLNPQDVEFGRGAIDFQPFDVWEDDEDAA